MAKNRTVKSVALHRIKTVKKWVSFVKKNTVTREIHISVKFNIQPASKLHYIKNTVICEIQHTTAFQTSLHQKYRYLWNSTYSRLPNFTTPKIRLSVKFNIQPASKLHYIKNTYICEIQHTAGFQTSPHQKHSYLWNSTYSRIPNFTTPKIRLSVKFNIQPASKLHSIKNTDICEIQHTAGFQTSPHQKIQLSVKFNIQPDSKLHHNKSTVICEIQHTTGFQTSPHQNMSRSPLSPPPNIFVRTNRHYRDNNCCLCCDMLCIKLSHKFWYTIQVVGVSLDVRL